METEVCRLCGGDGRIGTASDRSSATCPSCHGAGRRADTSSRFHDVTKTKPSHYRAEVVPKGPKVPVTPEGVQLASEVNASTVLTEDAKARLLAEIMNHESTHGRCTRTFLKKDRKQVRPHEYARVYRRRATAIGAARSLSSISTTANPAAVSIRCSERMS